MGTDQKMPLLAGLKPYRFQGMIQVQLQWLLQAASAQPTRDPRVRRREISCPMVFKDYTGLFVGLLPLPSALRFFLSRRSSTIRLDRIVSSDIAP